MTIYNEMISNLNSFVDISTVGIESNIILARFIKIRGIKKKTCTPPKNVPIKYTHRNTS